MHAALGFQIAVGVFALTSKRRGFDPDFFALDIDRLRFEAAPLDPALIHAQQHIRPITRFRPARTRMNGDERIRAIVFARKETAAIRILPTCG